jgi:hypothetical protein
MEFQFVLWDVGFGAAGLNEPLHFISYKERLAGSVSTLLASPISLKAASAPANLFLSG